MAPPSLSSSAATRDEAISLLRELVAINSVNGDLHEGPGELALARRVGALGEEFGAAVACQRALPESADATPPAWQPGAPPASDAGRWNVRLTVEGGTASAGERPRTLLFDVHLDTVPLQPMPQALEPRLEGDRLYGRGSCDTKGSLVAALLALRRLVAQPPELAGGAPWRVVVLGTVDEEHLKRGVLAAVRAGIAADGAIVGEPSQLDVIAAHKGAVRCRLHTRGKSAHTSMPELGDNAIYQMVEVIEAIRAELDPALANRTHPLVTPPTVTVSTIRGGILVNVVPDACTVELDRRTLPQEDPEAALAELDALLARLRERRPHVQVERETPYLMEWGMEASPAEPLLHIASAVCREMAGRGEVRGVPYGTDAAHLAGLAGIPTIVLGPGDIAQAHSADEWVDCAEVGKAVDIYETIARRFLAQSTV